MFVNTSLAFNFVKQFALGPCLSLNTDNNKSSVAASYDIHGAQDWVLYYRLLERLNSGITSRQHIGHTERGRFTVSIERPEKRVSP